MSEEKVCGYSNGHTENVLVRFVGAKLYKFGFRANERILARFDTEEKGRMYQEAFNAGWEAGYSTHPTARREGGK